METTQEKTIDVTEVTISGRTFRPCASTTFKQDMYVMTLLKAAGLVKLADGFDITKDLDEVAQVIIVEAFASGKLFDLLGAVMEEVGVPWTVDGAKANGEFFGNLSGTEDKKKLHGSIVGILLGFFVSGALSGKTSPKFSTEPRQPGDDARALRDGVRSEVPWAGTTESGTTSSETSPEGTPSNS
jgi:hypothetical protein